MIANKEQQNNLNEHYKHINILLMELSLQL